MIPTSHRIRRQRWDVRVATAPAALEARRVLRSAWSDVLAPVFEHAFDAAAPPGEVCHLKRLELRIRIPGDARLVDNLAVEVERQLTEQLPRALASGAGGSVVVMPAARSADLFDFATLLHYVRSGALPWYLAGGDDAAVVDSLRAVARAERERLAAAIRAERRDDAIVFRSLQLLDAADRQALVAALVTGAPAPWPQVLERLLQSNVSPLTETTSEHARLSVASRLYVVLASGAAREAGHVVADVLASARLEPRDRAALHELLLPLVPLAPASAFASPAHTASVAVPPAAESAATSPLRPHALTLPVITPVLEPRSSAHHEDAEAVSADVGLPVTNAGLVLLHPYIPTLFDHLGVSSRGAVAESSLPRAAALLYFVATGAHEIHEFDLGFIKPLLGLAPDTSLPVASGLVSPQDVEEIDAMLQSVITHWRALRSSSVLALRSTFLQRRGLLSPADPGWRLRVEPAPFDVLLDHLPWSVSVCKLPWMPHPVYTEWSTP